MTDHQFFIIVLGVLAALLVAVILYMQRTRQSELAQIAALFVPALEGLTRAADRALADHGQQLKPIHDGLAVAGTLVDEPDDYLVRVLARTLDAEPEVLVTALARLIRTASDLTDGVPAPEPDTPPPPPPEHARAGQFDEAPK